MENELGGDSPESELEVAPKPIEEKKYLPPLPEPLPPPPPQKQESWAETNRAQEKRPLKPENSTIEIIRKLENEKPFVTTAQKYGTALAESLMAKSNSKVAGRFNFDEALARNLEIKGGSYALIYKGNQPARIAPFVWSLDQQTRRTWALFTFNNFYGHTNSKMPWKRLRTPIVLTPFQNASEYADSFGKGYLAKFDENTQFQMPLTVKDSPESEKIRIDNRNFLNAALTLWMDLQQYTKPKTNMTLIIAIVAIAALLVLGYLFWPTISNVLGNLLPKG